MGMDSMFPLPVEETCGFTRLLQGSLEQIVVREEPSQVQKQIAGLHSRLCIAQPAIIRTAERLDLANRRSGLFVQGYHTLPLGFSSWNAQPRGSIWVRIQTINGQSTDLLASCS